MAHHQHRGSRRIPPANHVSVEFAAYSSPTGLCHHGFAIPGAVEGIKTFFTHIGLSSATKIVAKMLEEAPSSVLNIPTAQTTLKALAAIGTNLLLHPELEPEKGFASAHLTAQVISVLECILSSPGQPERVWAPQVFQQQLEFDSRRKLVEFLAQRIDCHCLDDEKEAVQNDQTGMCSLCYKRATDVKLFDCGRCCLVKYCGRECQVQHWPTHKNLCHTVRRASRASRTAGQEAEGGGGTGTISHGNAGGAM